MSELHTPTASVAEIMSEFQTTVDRRCPDTASMPSFLIVVNIFLGTILRQNSDIGLFKQENSIVFQFTQLGGLSSVVKKLEAADPIPHALLSLLEVLTVSDSLLETCPFFVPFVSAVARLYLVRECTDDRARVATLRVMTNLTNVRADVFMPWSSELGILFSNVLKNNACAVEECTFTTCCAINISLWELQNSKCELTCCFLEDAVLHGLVRAMVHHYHDGDATENLILSGYYSLLLAVISLHEGEELNARVKVMTAVSKGTQHLEVRDKIKSKPMTYVVVILQEFIIFQSQIGTFTKKSFSEISDILAQLIRANDITVTEE
ncbi:hypothetical protein STCU_08184 [Strigomonas culicis]|uniref:Uncharacterized protein n=1 Tax=Strigomonas culicis TaxID=28005 RepID=S9U1F3_9TRYP|nr:hypothetical protein STCU_08184 [Strigomonas culicis]|eukprot:EPY22664.1 hypothetical protein STCU_08184 [Strigomonas culicis]